MPVCRIKIYRARGEPRGSDLSSSPVATTARDNNSRHREAIRFKSRDSRGAVAEIQEGRSGGRAEPGRKPVAEAKDVRGRCRRVREPRPDDHDASCRDGEEIERDGPCWRLNAGRGRGVPGADSLAASPRAFYTLAGASAWRRRGVAEAVPGCPLPSQAPAQLLTGGPRAGRDGHGLSLTGVGGRRLAPRGW